MARLIVEEMMNESETNFNTLKSDIESVKTIEQLDAAHEAIGLMDIPDDLTQEEANSLYDMLNQKREKFEPPPPSFGDEDEGTQQPEQPKSGDNQQPEGEKEDLLQSFEERIEDLFLGPKETQGILKFLKYILANAKALNEETDEKLNALFKKFKAEEENSAAAELIVKLMGQKPEVIKLISDFIKAVRTQSTQQEPQQQQSQQGSDGDKETQTQQSTEDTASTEAGEELDRLEKEKVERQNEKFGFLLSNVFSEVEKQKENPDLQSFTDLQRLIIVSLKIFLRSAEKLKEQVDPGEVFRGLLYDLTGVKVTGKMLAEYIDFLNFLAVKISSEKKKFNGEELLKELTFLLNVKENQKKIKKYTRDSERISKEPDKQKAPEQGDLEDVEIIDSDALEADEAEAAQKDTEETDQPTSDEDDEAAGKTDGEDTTATTVATDTSNLEQPDYFDLDDEQKKNLFDSAKEFINEFYEQQYLYEQGVLTKNMLSAILRIKSGEEKEKAAKRSGGEDEKLQEAEEDKVEASKGRLRSIQIAFRTFLREIKATKKAMEDFAEVAESGSIVASSKKRKFIKLLQRQQRDIVSLHNGLSMIMKNTLDEAEDKDMSTEVKWGKIEEHYDAASKALRGILGLSNEEQSELRDAVKLMDDAISNLRDLSGYFPNVNPFGRKDDNYDQFGQEYKDAVEEIKSYALQPILELTRTGEASKNVIQKAMETLKQFATQISTIFGVKSQFKDAPPPSDKDEEAAQASEEKQPMELDDFNTKLGDAFNVITTFNPKARALFKEIDPTDDEIKILFKFYRFMRNRKRRANENLYNKLKEIGYIEKDIQDFGRSISPPEFETFKYLMNRMVENNLIERLPELIYPVPDQTMNDIVMSIHDVMQTKNINAFDTNAVEKVKKELDSEKLEQQIQSAIDSAKSGEKSYAKEIEAAINYATSKEKETPIQDPSPDFEEIIQTAVDYAASQSNQDSEEKKEFSSFIKSLFGIEKDKNKEEDFPYDDEAKEKFSKFIKPLKGFTKRKQYKAFKDFVSVYPNFSTSDIPEDYDMEAQEKRFGYYVLDFIEAFKSESKKVSYILSLRDDAELKQLNQALKSFEKSKEGIGQEKVASFVQEINNELFEERLANKLKPLIREMLRRNK
jgi:hypothetical protein